MDPTNEKVKVAAEKLRKQVERQKREEVDVKTPPSLIDAKNITQN